MWTQIALIAAIQFALFICTFALQFRAQKKGERQIVTDAALLYGVPSDEAMDAVSADPLKFNTAMLERYDPELWQNRVANTVGALCLIPEWIGTALSIALWALPLAYWLDFVKVEDAIVFAWLITAYHITWFILAVLINLLVMVVTGRGVGQPARAREVMLKARDEDIEALRRREL